MGMAVGNKKGFRSDINITPYIDILLTLLVIFMIISPVHQRDLTVKVPQPAPSVQSVSSPNTIVVSISESDEIAINQQAVSISALGSQLMDIFNARQNKTMFISASPDLPYGDVVHVIDIAKGAGVGNIGLLTKELH
jgi:biopolymer transport protein TolR